MDASNAESLAQKTVRKENIEKSIYLTSHGIFLFLSAGSACTSR